MSSSTTRFMPLLPFAVSKQAEDESRCVESVEPASSQSLDLEIADADRVEESVAISDEGLVARVSAGDTNAALGLLFRRYARLVRSVAHKILHDRSEADDLVQEVFILIHKKAASFDASKASARSWILQMTYHRAFNRRRYLSRRHFYAQLDFEDVGRQLTDSRTAPERVDQFLDGSLKNAALQELMAALSDKQQKTLKLYFFEGYTLDEIATELRQTRDNVRHHYFRGLEKLRKQIFPDHNGR